MTKSTTLLSIGLAVAVIIGCGLNPAGTVTVTVASIDTVVIGSAGSGAVHGTIETDSAITNVTMSIKRGASTALNITPNFNSNGYNHKDTIDLYSDMQTRISASSGAAVGIDTLIITVRSGSITKGTSHPFVVR
jgi:hypothetical protein